MRWSVLGLVVMGVIAAVSVTVLVNAMSLGRNSLVASGPKQMVVAAAAEDLLSARLVRPEMVVMQEVPERHAPQNSLTSSTQIVGRVLGKAMLKGEVFTEECIATERQGQYLAGILEPGMRLVSLTLNKAESVAGLLYVGCKVDVLACYGRTTSERSTHRILEDVEVVAIEDESITSPKGKTPKLGRPSARLNVTLMLAADQAEKLQSAKSEASIALAMRNPLETPQPALQGQAEPSVPGGMLSGPQTRVWVMEVIRAGENETKEFSEEVHGTTP